MDFFQKLRKTSSSDASKRHASTTSSDAQTPRSTQQTQFVFPSQNHQKIQAKTSNSPREPKTPLKISAPIVNLQNVSQKQPLQDINRSHVAKTQAPQAPAQTRPQSQKQQTYEKNTLEPYRQQKIIESSKEVFQRPVFTAQIPNVNKINSVNTKIANQVKEPLNKKPSLINLLTQNDNQKKSFSEEPIFDPEPAKEECDTFSHTIFLDDRSFMVDDDELDKEVSEITSKSKSNIQTQDSISIVNEVPEGRLSKHSTRSSRASSSIGSASISDASNRLADFSSEIGTVNMTRTSDYSESDSTHGAKNELMDTLMKKFNVKLDLNASSNDSRKNSLNKNNISTPLKRKIKRNQFEKQLSEGGTRIDKNLIKVNTLPQTFVCKYLGKYQAKGLWGVAYTREPIDRLVNTAKRLKSLEELPTMDVLISEKGIYVVQNFNNSKKSAKNFRSGLIPISNISYGVQDNKYGKIFSCIVVRERESKTLVECYAFLNSKNQLSKKMALSLTLAFKEYGKLLQLKESNIRRTINLDEHQNTASNRDSVV
jgi:hypothetical protein